MSQDPKDFYIHKVKLFSILLLLSVQLLTLNAQADNGINCEIVNRPVDCRRLTVQECETAQREQERKNLNRQLYCNDAKIRNAMTQNHQAANKTGSNAGSDTGAGNGDGTDASEETANTGNGASSETDATDEGQPGSLTSQIEEAIKAQSSSTPSPGSKEPVTDAPPTPTTGGGLGGSESRNTLDRKDGSPDWGSGALCDKFKAAHDKASSAEAKQRILKQAESYGCRS